MSNSGGMLDAYLICQALGWEWNITSMIFLTAIPFIVFGAILLIIFVIIPVICDLIDKIKR